MSFDLRYPLFSPILGKVIFFLKVWSYLKTLKLMLKQKYYQSFWICLNVKLFKYTTSPMRRDNKDAACWNQRAPERWGALRRHIDDIVLEICRRSSSSAVSSGQQLYRRPKGSLRGTGLCSLHVIHCACSQSGGRRCNDCRAAEPPGAVDTLRASCQRHTREH